MTAQAPPGKVRAVTRPGDRIFSGSAFTAGVAHPRDARRRRGLPDRAEHPGVHDADATTSRSSPTNFWDYVGPLVFGTLWAAALALHHGRSRSRSASRSSSRTTRPAASPRCSATSSTCSPPCRRSCSASGASACSPRLIQPFYVWLVENLGWFPLFAGPVSGTGRTILTAAHRARRHGAADHHRDLPRGLPADARCCTRRPRSRSAPPAGR